MAVAQGGAKAQGARRWPRRVAIGVAVVLLVAVVAAAVGSWLASSLLIDPHHDLVRDDVAVKAVGPDRVTLARTKASARAGVYGLDWRGGHAIVGDVVARGDGTVTRALLGSAGGLRPGTKVAIDPDVWDGTPRSALGIPFVPVAVPDPLGPMPAWQVPGRGRTWVLFVHGIDGSRAGGLRPLATLHRLRLPTLLISYRNDAGAPRSPDGHIHLGMTEWKDLDAAARWAVAHGAQRFVLYGDSMGGAIVTRFMHESALAPGVAALVLDAPVLDWRSVIAHQASRLDVPFMATPVEWTIGQRIDVDWNALDEIRQAGSFHLPILLFQGLDDPLVPPADTRAFAAHVPGGRATFVGVPGAGHIQSWNADPARYSRTLATFLAPLRPGTSYPLRGSPHADARARALRRRSRPPSPPA
jgi:pimeloyl-ACP methyl ester carboxylesterase